MSRAIFVTYRSQAATNHKQLMIEDEQVYDQPGLAPWGLPAEMQDSAYSFVTLPRLRRKR